MAVVDRSAFSIFRGQRLYDDEQPLNKNDVEVHRRIHHPTSYIVVVGKSLLIDSLVENNLGSLWSPGDINGMIDAAKYADVVILMVDASYGFEMNCGLKDGLYKMLEIYGLAEMLSDSELLPLSWRAKHPYVLVDHFEVDHRNVSLYGYLRGYGIKEGAKVHIAGAGDFSIAGITRLYDHLNPYPVSLTSYFGPGNYLKLDILDVPPEIVKYFNSHHPILVGGIILQEEKSGFMMVKLRRHSWHMNLLMSGVPITISAGWRRYQTNVIYAMENENGQHQLLTKSPENKDCLAVIWGPLAPPKTRIVAVLNKFYCLKNKLLLNTHRCQVSPSLDSVGSSTHRCQVGPSRQMPDLRCGVVIHEGKCGYVSSPNPLELFYSVVV
ncbi:hypothetical protein MKW92_029809 [Papaver armeniacum]|nr:hypothetical protein MKW92_029809 [Papaver armeniacum]